MWNLGNNEVKEQQPSGNHIIKIVGKLLTGGLLPVNKLSYLRVNGISV
ncbi:hypothetical protein M2273_003734 [Mucilaginibacter lappiensis]